MLKPWRVAALILAFLAVASAGRAGIRPPGIRRRFLVANTSRFCRWLLAALGVSVVVKGGEDSSHPGGAAVLVANHLSYLDVVAIAALGPAVFVTSEEVREERFVGTMARLAGSLFVERRRRTAVSAEIVAIRRCLDDGSNVVIFPEATSTDGRRVLPFKPSLLAAAVESGVPVRPLCLNYLSVDGEKLGPAHRDRIFYYGDSRFFDHLKGVLELKSIVLELHRLPPVETAGRDRKIVAAEAFEAIRREFVPV